MHNQLMYLNGAKTLVEIFRGHGSDGHAIIECIHQGLLCVIDGLGNTILAHGPIGTIVHMRSCAKPLQVLPLLELGYFDKIKKSSSLALTLADLALMMSSHTGQTMHTSRVAELLNSLGLDATALRCGVQLPLDEETRQELIRSSAEPTTLHHNCSGKHTAVIMTCLAKGWDLVHYEDENHPLQQKIRSLILAIGDLAQKDLAFGIDGCSLPSWAIPLEKIALIYARLALWQHDLPEQRPPWFKTAFANIWSAATSHPEFLAGTNRFDTELMKAGKGQIFSKTGADGMHAIAILPGKKYPFGLGVALKVSDGDARQTIRSLVIKKLLSDLHLWPSEPKLDRFLPSFKNYRGLTTGGALVSIPTHHSA